MIIHNCKQGSPEWLALRAGIPTASEFDKILTPGGKASKSAERYLHELLAERIMGHPRIQAVSMWMDRGTETEAEAVSFYELNRGCDTERVGFMTNDERTVGASPDRLLADDPDGLLEIKVPSEHVHVGYLLAAAGASEEYRVQTQGQLWISGRSWVDILSYHPDMPPALFRIHRDEEFIAKLADAVAKFSATLEAMTVDFKARGWIKPPVEPAADDYTGNEFLNQADYDWAMQHAAQVNA